MDYFLFLIDVYGKVGQTTRNDDDVYDRYSHRWTIVILGICIIVLSAKQFVGKPIECIPPAEFTDEHKIYIENYCWIHSTYSIDDQTALTRDFVRGSENSRTTPYYIWIPYILLTAALLTYLPAWLWHAVGHRATFDIPAMINQLSKTNLTDSEERENMLTILTKHYENAQRFNRTNRFTKRLTSIFMFFAGGGILTGIYFLIKILYLINSIGQFFLINYYLKIDYWSYGYKISEVFPRIVFCDFTIRYLADNNQNYIVQCTLPVNLYNERILTVYWFWLIFLSCVTFYGIVNWLIQMSYRGRRSFLKRHLRINSKINFNRIDPVLFNKFTNKYLGGDGILFLQLIAKNTSPVVAGELLGIMWQRFSARESQSIIIVSTDNN